MVENKEHLMRIRPLLALSACLSLGASALPAGASNDPSYNAQWNLQKIHATDAWEETTGSGAIIGIIDTGVDLHHEELAGKVIAHTSCVGSRGDSKRCKGSGQDDNGHGTHVAGIAVARKDNGRGIAGVAPDAKLVVAKVLNGNGAGTEDDIVAGIKWAVDHGAQVINLSVGDPNFVFTSTFGTSMESGIEYAWKHGAIPVIASGNLNVAGLGSSNYGDIHAVIVGATGPDDKMAKYSSPLGNAKWSIVAPGGAGDKVAATDVRSAWWDRSKPNTYRSAAGTSMATPHVAGGIGLLLSLGYSPSEAVARLLATADPRVQCACTGIMDLKAATTAARETGNSAD
jgi:subtilisin family serine protease